MRVTVRERATVAFAQLGMRDVWVLNVAVPGAPATMWIDAKAHVPLRVRYDLPTVSFSDERVTPVI
jgi:tartrate dehydratase beta subunit/fumarate hydratase class I family protein